jgi:subtilase family serine protease
VTDVTAPARALPGQLVTLNSTVQNVGTGMPVGQTSTVAFYLSTDSVLDGADVRLGTRAIAGLAAAATSTGPTAVTIPASTPLGAYFVIARADDAGTVAEAREGNNVRATASRLIVGPDLVVTAVTGPVQASPGEIVTLGATVQNVGTAMPAAATSTLAFYLSADSVLDGADVLLGSRSIPGLAAAATFTGTLTVAIPAGTAAGTYFVLARADAGGSVTEARETNNVRATAITIAAP